MEARSAMSWYCSTILAVVVALFLSASLGTGAGADLKGSCAATPHPEACVSALQKDAVARMGAAATPRDLAEAAIRAASDAGAAAGDYARKEMDVVKDNGMWQCLNECAEDIEEALSHLDDSEGGVDDAKLKDVKLFLDTAEQDAWNCDQSCKGAANTPVKAALLAKNKDFENLMAVTLALLKRVTGGDDAPGPAPAKP
ncbi:hypothetical protein SEVIR_9G024200v4 [Setaria viridis]|uniref:Pectinesterase inhibitor domain-containing protein n=3 Tax=Setaria TaxID=4554 RepID=A0A368SCK9_SETIT|nr:uncharacterized protein LOC101767024 [Setaria italica]XP_034572063.1 uncharacterized protein LOC117836699 [Setaria viridis]RCV40101.1 hypothetical protein SETIT_9G024700v2 [Setaria italica]TKV90369.1 hypothetical protein SEVIR_9G024200v2 [Setaria viridis]